MVATCFRSSTERPPNGSAEETFGEILRKDFRGLRHELVISSKAGYEMWPGPYGIGASKKYLIASVDDSLRRLGLDYLDIFYAHRPWPDVPMEETMGALAQIVRQGKAVRRHLVVQPGAHDGGIPTAEGRGRPALDPSTVVLDVEPAY